jgi:hypothetical protein
MNTNEIMQGALFVVVCALFAFLKYRELELRHKENILSLQRTGELRNRKPLSWGKVATTACFSILLFLVIVRGIIFASGLGHYENFFIYILLAELSLVVVTLSMVVIRDVKILRRS